MTPIGPAAETSVNVYATSRGSVPRVVCTLTLFGRETPRRTHVLVTAAP